MSEGRKTKIVLLDDRHLEILVQVSITHRSFRGLGERCFVIVLVGEAGDVFKCSA